MLPASSVASMSLQPHDVSTLTYLDQKYASVIHPMDPKAEETKALFTTIETCAMDQDNWLQRRMTRSLDGDLLQDLDSYVDACYWDFLSMVTDSTWPTLNALARLTHRSRILRYHQSVGRDKKERHDMEEVFEVAWADFYEKIVMDHLPV